MNNDIEIELKLPLHNGREVDSFLKKSATFRYESLQHDIYFNAPNRNFLEDIDNVNEWFRIRIAGDKVQINYKDFQPHDTNAKTHCIEYETNVDSYDQLRKILEALNFSKLVDVKKTRKAWDYMDVEVSIDSVEGLGSFIEVEYKGQLTDVKKVREHLFDILKAVGAKTGMLELRGYPYLVLEKQGLLSSVA